MARRLVELGVPFVEVDLGGWDNHANIFPTLADQKLPEMDKAMSGLVADLADRGLLDDTVVIWMGEFGRKRVLGTDRIAASRFANLVFTPRPPLFGCDRVLTRSRAPLAVGHCVACALGAAEAP